MKEIMKLVCQAMQLSDSVENSCFRKALLLIIARRLTDETKRHLNGSELYALKVAADFCKADTIYNRALLKKAINNYKVKSAGLAKNVA